MTSQSEKERQFDSKSNTPFSKIMNVGEYERINETYSMVGVIESDHNTEDELVSYLQRGLRLEGISHSENYAQIKSKLIKQAPWLENLIDDIFFKVINSQMLKKTWIQTDRPYLLYGNNDIGRHWAIKKIAAELRMKTTYIDRNYLNLINKDGDSIANFMAKNAIANPIIVIDVGSRAINETIDKLIHSDMQIYDKIIDRHISLKNALIFIIVDQTKNKSMAEDLQERGFRMRDFHTIHIKNPSKKQMIDKFMEFASIYEMDANITKACISEIKRKAENMHHIIKLVEVAKPVREIN